MKILILTGSYSPDVGGIAELVSGFAGGLLANGTQAHILAAAPGAARFSTPALPVAEFELSRHGYWKRILSCRRAVLKLVKEQDFDRLIASTWSPLAVALPVKVKNRKLPLDILCHGMDLLEPSKLIRYRILMRHTLRRAGKVIANSRYTANLARSRGATEENIVVIHPGVNSEQFVPGQPDSALLARYQIPLDAPVLLSVGRLVERKGFDLVIRALPLVLESRPSAVYLIVGDGPDRQRLSDLAVSCGVAGSVRFAENVSMSERVAHYQLATLFVMPNRLIKAKGDVEGFGIVFLEAACCQVASIGGQSGGVPDAIEDGITGFLVDPTRPEDCAKQIIFLLSNEEVRKKMGKAACERARAHFSWSILTSYYLSQIR